MKQKDIQIENLKKEKELIKAIRNYEPFFNRDTINILINLVQLKESIFRQIAFGEKFHNLELFYDIAKYNIIKRSIAIINQTKTINQAKLKLHSSPNIYTISYSLNDIDFFNIFKLTINENFSTNLLPESKAKISIYGIPNPKNQLSPTTIKQEEISILIAQSLIDDWNISLKEDFGQCLVKHLSWINIYNKPQN